MFHKSANKRNHGPTIEWHGGACPVAPGTPVSVMFRWQSRTRQKYWMPINRPESRRWTHTGGGDDILAYYERLPVILPSYGRRAEGSHLPALNADWERIATALETIASAIKEYTK